MATNWGDHTEEQRGRLIRYYITNTDKANDASDGVLNVAVGDLGKLNLGSSYAANQYPTKAHVKAFRKFLMINYRDYLDGFNFGFRGDVSDYNIGVLGGDNRNLETHGEEGFIEGSGILGADARETGVEKEIKDREITSSAILAPDQYIKNANEDLKKIDRQSLDVFKASFKKYYEEYKYTSEESKKRALADKNAYYNMLKKQHDLIYKADLYKKASKRINKNV